MYLFAESLLSPNDLYFYCTLKINDAITLNYEQVFYNQLPCVRTGFFLVSLNCMSPLRTEPINLSTSCIIISPTNDANFLFRSLQANKSLSTDLNPALSNAFKNADCLVASKSVQEMKSLEPKAEFCHLVCDF